MGKKAMIRCVNDFNSSHLSSAATLMGVSFYIRAVYYFGFTRLEQLGFGNLLLFLFLPMAAELAFLVLIRGVRLNAPMVYAGMGAAYCLLLLLQSFQYGNILRTVLAVLACLVCAALLMLTVSGMIKKELTAAAFFLTGAVRLLFDLGPYILKLRLIAFLPEAACICGLLALGFYVLGLKPARARRK